MSKDTSSPHEAAIAAERLHNLREQHPRSQHPSVQPQQHHIWWEEYRHTRERNVQGSPEWFWPEYQRKDWAHIDERHPKSNSLPSEKCPIEDEIHNQGSWRWSGPSAIRRRYVWQDELQPSNGKSPSIAA